MWVARDKDGTLNLWFNKPKRAVNFWHGQQKQDGWKATEEFIQNKHEIDGELFPELTWDDEPIEVCLVEKSKHHICYMKEVSGEVTAISERLFLELLHKGYPIIKQTEKSTIIQNYFNYVDSKR